MIQTAKRSNIVSEASAERTQAAFTAFSAAWTSFRQRRRFFFFGGGGGGFAAAIAAGEGTAGAGMKRLSAYCWPIVQKLVVIQ